MQLRLVLSKMQWAVESVEHTVGKKCLENFLNGSANMDVDKRSLVGFLFQDVAGCFFGKEGRVLG